MKGVNISKLQGFVSALLTIVQKVAKNNRERKQSSASRGDLPNFVKGDFVLVSRDDFNSGEQLALRWRGPLLVTKALSDYFFQVEALRNVM